jgi:peroxiredoxin
LENINNIKRLSIETRDKHKLVGLSLNKKDLNDYVEKNQFDFPILTDIPDEVQSAYKLGGTPQTIVISPDGKVIKNWVGVYTGNVASEVQQYFKVRLPNTEIKSPVVEVRNENK